MSQTTPTVRGHRIAWRTDGFPAPGDYMQAPSGNWHAMTPNGHLADLSRHQVTVHEDGTITVSESIKVFWPATDTAPEVVHYHGLLEHGVWRNA